MNILQKDLNCYSRSIDNYVQVLATLSLGKKNLSEISISTGISKGRTHIIVKKLHQTGYVNKTFSGRDRYISLTDKGMCTYMLV